MRRITIVGLALTCLVTCSAGGATSALAANPAPEFGRCLKKATPGGAGYSDGKCTKGVSSGAKTEWTNTIVKSHFTIAIQEGTDAVFRTVDGFRLTCRGASGSGEIANAKELANVVIAFTGCEGYPCLGMPQETVTNPLSGVIGLATESSNLASERVAQELHGPGKGNLVEFACGPGSVLTRGSLLARPIADRMVASALEKLTAGKGEQQPEHFAGGGLDEHTLEMSVLSKPFEEAGLSLTYTVTFEEPIEVNTVV